MKKLLALLLALTMLFSVAALFAGCEEENKKKSSSSKNNDDDDDDEKDEEEEKDGDKDSDENDENSQNDGGDADEDAENQDGNSGTGNQNDDLEYAKQAFWDYINVAQYADVDKLEKVAPEEFWEANGYDSLDEIKRTLPQAVDLYFEELESQYGSNIQMHYEITKHAVVEDALVTAYAEALADSAGIDADGVEKAITLTVTGTIRGDNSEETMTDNEIIVVCYNGVWYPITGNSYEYDGETQHYYIFMGDFVVYITRTYLESQVPAGGEVDQQVTITDPESALKNYCEVYYLNKVSGLEACAPQGVWDILCQDYTMDDIKMLYPLYMEQTVQMLEEEYGTDLSMEIEVTYTDDFDSIIREMGGVLENDWGLDRDLLTQVTSVSFSATIIGSQASSEIEGESLWMICYDGMWYPIEFTTGRAVEVTFLIEHFVLEVMDY